jgi:helix-turn-helix protein
MPAVGERDNVDRDGAISYNIEQAALATGTTPWAVRTAIRRGELPAKIIGRSYVVSHASLKRWVEP